MEGELTSVKVSQDSRYALINRALDALGMHAVSAFVRPSAVNALTYHMRARACRRFICGRSAPGGRCASTRPTNSCAMSSAAASAVSAGTSS